MPVEGCSYRSVTKEELIKHKYRHASPDNRPKAKQAQYLFANICLPIFVCQYCDKASKRKTANLIHEKRHTVTTISVHSNLLLGKN